MNLNDIVKSKQSHDAKVKNDKYIGPDKPINKNTGWECLDRARTRMNHSIPGDVLGESFTQALNTAEDAEVFSTWENNDEELYKVILKNLKDDWQRDSKFINAPKGKGVEVGNTLTWDRLQNRWLVMWQDYNINEFFRGEIQKATHLISWKNENGIIQKQWAVVQGPIETRAKYEQTRGNAIIGRQNDTTEIWIGANNKKAIDSLTRYDRIRIAGRTWEVHVRDDISNENIYRMSLTEDFNNSAVDDIPNAIPAGQVDFAENDKPIDEQNGIRIVGPSKVRELIATEFRVVDFYENSIVDAEWTVENDKYHEVEDGLLYVIGKRVGDTVTITASHTLGENTITCQVVGAFSQLDN